MLPLFLLGVVCSSFYPLPSRTSAPRAIGPTGARWARHANCVHHALGWWVLNGACDASWPRPPTCIVQVGCIIPGSSCTCTVPRRPVQRRVDSRPKQKLFFFFFGTPARVPCPHRTPQTHPSLHFITVIRYEYSHYISVSVPRPGELSVVSYKYTFEGEKHTYGSLL